jgi:2-polyprenyl-3-methyl-5-hydroxy-6-metoxy-1,4-benzoquinol methylase
MNKHKSLEKLAKTSANPAFDVPEQKPNAYSVYLAKEYGDFSSPKSVLDIGCNYGNFLFSMNQMSSVGIDLRIEPLKTLNKYCNRKYGLVQASAIDLPFKDLQFDTVFLWDVIEHVPINKEVILLRQVNRILSKKGFVMLSTPSDNMWSITSDPAFFLRRHRH